MKVNQQLPYWRGRTCVSQRVHRCVAEITSQLGKSLCLIKISALYRKVFLDSCVALSKRSATGGGVGRCSKSEVSNLGSSKGSVGGISLDFKAIF